ncbi:MAG TPA: hypothetical protein VFU15_11775 [Bacteroidia bacterium]|nr:hypothetical protein [Bacteroidia bacterium]
MKKPICLRFASLILFLFSTLVLSALDEVDSLERLLKQEAPDSVRIDRLMTLSKIFMYSGGEASLKNADAAMRLAHSSGDRSREMQAYATRGKTFLL